MHPVEKDEKFPGPGTYNAGNNYEAEEGKSIKGVPGFKICQPNAKARER